jgi:formyl-CoA transferase/CoA:oxalate CoA-transferase
MAGALSGITVVDLSTHLSGPYCTMLLGDLGADVIKVERPGGDDARGMPPFVDGRSAPFDIWNRNKRSIVLDAKKEPETLRALVAQADVLVENMRPGTLDRMGMGWDALHAAHPRLILASISGFGQTGPWAGHGGFDLMTQGMAGLMAGNGPAEGEPHRLPIAISDLTAGLQCAIAILAALNARHTRGQGQRVEASLFASALSLGVYEAAHVLALGTRPERLGQSHRGTSPYRAFQASDGWLTIGASQPNFWPRFCAIIGAPRLPEDPRFATNADRVANNAALVAIIAGRLAEQPRDHWLEAFAEAGIPAEPVLAYDEALAHPQAAAIGVLAPIPGAMEGIRATLATPFRLSATPPSVRAAAPRLDEHGAAIRATLPGRAAAE